MTTFSSALDREARSRIVSYIIEASKEADRLERELWDLQPYIFDDIVVAYKRYRVKRAARDYMIQQIRDCEEALRNLVWLFVENIIIIIINSSSCGCHSDLKSSSIFLITSRMESLAPMNFLYLI
jgi:hypothetical protein